MYNYCTFLQSKSDIRHALMVDRAEITGSWVRELKHIAPFIMSLSFTPWKHMPPTKAAKALHFSSLFQVLQYQTCLTANKYHISQCLDAESRWHDAGVLHDGPRDQAENQNKTHTQWTIQFRNALLEYRATFIKQYHDSVNMSYNILVSILN